MGEESDLRVRQHETANEIIFQITFERAAKRFFRQTSPGLARNVIDIEASFHFIFCNERLEHAVPRVLGEDTRQIVELLHLLEFALASRKIDNRSPAQLLIDIADQ